MENSIAAVEQFVRTRREGDLVIVEPAAGQRGRGRGLATLGIALVAALVLGGIASAIAPKDLSRMVISAVFVVVLIPALLLQRRAARTIIEGDSVHVPGAWPLWPRRTIQRAAITGFEVAEARTERDAASQRRIVLGAAWFLLKDGERVRWYTMPPLPIADAERVRDAMAPLLLP